MLYMNMSLWSEAWHFLMCFMTASVLDAVDLLNIKTMTWTTARLSVARYDLVTTSINRDVAMFAGGIDNDGRFSAVVDCFWSSDRSWTVAQLSVARAYFGAASIGSFAIFAGGRVPLGVCIWNLLAFLYP